MSSPIIDFELFAVNQLPPSKRKKKWIAYFYGMVSQIVRLAKILFKYKYGTQAGFFDIGATYNFGDEIIYKYRVYKSRISLNLGNTPDSSPIEWEIILGSFIGTDESSNYRHQQLILEWALNRYFAYEVSLNSFVGFVQPDDPITPTKSTIFLSAVVETYPTLLVGIDEAESYLVGEDGGGWITEDEDFALQTQYQFDVNIPTSVYSSINVSTTIADTIIRQFLDRYIVAGIFYNIVTY